MSLAREEMISPELQQRDVDSYLARMSQQSGRLWRVVETQEDLDVSCRSFAREGIQRLMALMREGAITTILTYEYDRVGRNLEQALKHLREVEQVGGQVVSVSEPSDASTAIGHFMRSQTLAMAELYSQQIGEGWKRVHQKRIADGLPTNGRFRGMSRWSQLPSVADPGGRGYPAGHRPLGKVKRHSGGPEHHSW